LPAFLLLAAGWGAPPAARSAQPLLIETTEYFEALDYVGPGGAAKTMNYECRLRAIAEAARPDLSSPARQVREAAGLTLAYAAMFMVNVQYGVRDRAIDYEILTACGRYAPGMGLDPELLSRERAIAGLLGEASLALPGDVRVRAWKAGSRIRVEALEKGHPTREALEELVAVAEEGSTFNLFSALIVTRDHEFPRDLLERLFQAAKKMTTPENPCRAEPGKCAPGSKAPHSSRAAITLIADALLEHAERNPGTERDAMTALFLYVSLRVSPELADGIEKWKPRGYVFDRIKRAYAVTHERVPADWDYWRSWSGV